MILLQQRDLSQNKSRSIYQLNNGKDSASFSPNTFSTTGVYASRLIYIGPDTSQIVDKVSFQVYVAGPNSIARSLGSSGSWRVVFYQYDPDTGKAKKVLEKRSGTCYVFYNTVTTLTVKLNETEANTYRPNAFRVEGQWRPYSDTYKSRDYVKVVDDIDDAIRFRDVSDSGYPIIGRVPDSRHLFGRTLLLTGGTNAEPYVFDLADLSRSSVSILAPNPANQHLKSIYLEVDTPEVVREVTIGVGSLIERVNLLTNTDELLQGCPTAQTSDLASEDGLHWSGTVVFNHSTVVTDANCAEITVCTCRKDSNTNTVFIDKGELRIYPHTATYDDATYSFSTPVSEIGAGGDIATITSSALPSFQLLGAPAFVGIAHINNPSVNEFTLVSKPEYSDEFEYAIYSGTAKLSQSTLTASTVSLPSNATDVVFFGENSGNTSDVIKIKFNEGGHNMPTKDARVLFKAGLKANFDLLATKDGNTVYFCTDTKQIFVGDAEYTKGGAILTAAPTTTTVGDYGKLYAYNGNLYLCEGLVGTEYKYTRVANVNDVVGSVTSVAIGEGLTTPDGGDNPITSTGTIQHGIPTGAEAHTSTAPATQTATFGGTIDLETTSTDKFGHVVGLTTTTVTLPTQTELSRTQVDGTAITPGYGEEITVVTDVTVADGHVVKPTLTKITLPSSDDTTYTFASTKEGKVTVTPSVGEAYDVTINGWSDLAKKTELASVFTFKGTVPTIEDLPAQAIVGDVYHVTEASAEYVCITASTETEDAEYEELGSEIDLSDYALSADVIQRVTGATGLIPEFTADGTLVSTGKKTSDFVEKTTTIAGVDLQDNITKDELNTALGISGKIKAEAENADYTKGAVKCYSWTDGEQDGYIKASDYSLYINGDIVTRYTDVACTNAVGSIQKQASDVVAPVYGSIGDAIASLEATVGPGGSVTEQITAAINNLDATVTNAVETGTQPDVVVTVTETDGKLTAVTATVTAERFDAYGAAQAVADGLGTAAAADVATTGVAQNDTTLPTTAQVKSYVDAAIAWGTF